MFASIYFLFSLPLAFAMKEFAVFHVNGWDGNQISDISLDPKLDDVRPIPVFTAQDYSKFKYGHIPTVERFGQLLAKVFVRNHPEYFDAKLADNLPELVVTGSAYKNLPVAATYLTQSFFNHINEARLDNGMSAVSYTKIGKSSVGVQDYSKKNKKDREATNKGSTYLPVADDMAGKHVLVVDDCLITGGQRDKIDNAIKGLEVAVADITYLYVAYLNPQMPQVTKAENYMNHAYVNSHERWYEILADPSLLEISVRATKYFFNNKESPVDALHYWLSKLPCKSIYEMYYGSINDGLYKASEGKYQMLKKNWEIKCHGVSRSTTPFNRQQVIDYFRALKQ